MYSTVRKPSARSLQLFEKLLCLARERRVRLPEQLHALDDGALAVGGGGRPEGSEDVRQLEHREQRAREGVRVRRPREAEQGGDAAAHDGVVGPRQVVLSLGRGKG